MFTRHPKRARARLIAARQRRFLVRNGDAKAQKIRASKQGGCQEIAQVINQQRHVDDVGVRRGERRVVKHRAAAVRDWVADDAQHAR